MKREPSNVARRSKHHGAHGPSGKPWNGKGIHCAHQFLEFQAAQRPSALAVHSANGTLTYGELNARANQLAHYLRRCGVGLENQVALCLESSLEAIVGIFAILKTGAAYIPIDASYPRKRISFMLSDAQVAAVLTRKSLLSVLPKTATHTVCMDVALPTLMTESRANLRTAAPTSRSLAYVIYTSGSTGRPKGVMVEHRSLINYIISAVVDYNLSPSDRVLQFSSLSWDTSVEEIFPCLSSGATLVLRDENTVELPHVFWRKCRARGVTLLNLPTAYWNVLVNDVEFSSSILPTSLRLLIIGGERVLAPQVVLWQRAVGGQVKLINTYGLTEATAAVTSFSAMETLSLTEDTAKRIPIGRPIRNVQTYVLDPRLQPLPVGVAGELYVGGAGVARGYLGLPSLTAQRFLPDPFSSKGGARMCRTGDHVRLREDGELEFIGREDQQVKLQGRRIELGEIEATLVSHPKVHEAAVLTNNDSKRRNQLVAYVVSVSRQTSRPTRAELDSHLLKTLPAYMVPAAYVGVKVLPRMPNGKLDRLALLRLERMPQGKGVRPRGPIEEMLTGVWSEVLGVPVVRPEDNFFELGGDSLASLEIISKAAQMGWELTVDQIFRNPTIRDVAKVAIPLVQNEPESTKPGGARNRYREAPLSLAQRHIWFMNQALPGRSFFSIPSPQRIAGKLDVRALQNSITEVFRRHEILRTTYVVRDGVPFQLIAPPAPFDISVLDLRGLTKSSQEERVQKILTTERLRHFDLSFEGPVRGILLQLGTEEYILSLTFHHVAFDHWSIDVFFRELADLYKVFVAGRPPSDDTAREQYADYATWQNDWLETSDAIRQLDYWLEHLNKSSSLLDLPTDHGRSRPRTFRYKKVTLSLTSSTTKRLQEFSSRAQTTPFVTLLATLNVFLNQITGQDAIRVGTLTANRNAAYVDTIGLFVNTLILQTDFLGQTTFEQMIQRVRSVTLEAMEHQSLPFERLFDRLSERFDLGRVPLFQVLYIFQNSPEPALELFNLIVRPWESETKGDLDDLRASNFDLIMEVVPGENYLDVIWHFNADLFETDSVEKMLRDFRRLLTVQLNSPNKHLRSRLRKDIAANQLGEKLFD